MENQSPTNPLLAQVETLIGLGANVGSKNEIAQRFRDALLHLEATGQVTIIRVSSLYGTPPWGNTDQAEFVNAAALLTVTMPAAVLLETLKNEETRLGRVSRERWGPRELDLDILLYGDAAMDTPTLKIPHPFLLERPFALIPLLEIYPQARMPEGTLISQLVPTDLGNLPDNGIKRIQDSSWYLGT
jgi:2-amino-4-hydroxy-6-hydroxymethyldihydropteridine diphosphokinase